MEYGASAAVATWTARGIEVAYLLLTAGEAGMADPPETVGPLREREQRQACAQVGVRYLTVLRHPDGMLEPGLPLRRDVAREVRRFRPDAVLTAAFGVEAYGGLNQADHRAAGRSAVDGTRDADNRWVFRELAETENLPPWHTRWLLVTGDDRPTHALAVTEPAVQAGIASLRSHAAYLSNLPHHPDPGELISGILRRGGAAAGTEYAALFRAFDLGGLAGND
ncbi:PIG-L family deacetylase [Skermania piniformis]|uniref:PIG-L family deacetylase n=2 Tax=Skermania pinensis TaxID=39122 RepID=A0ABX8SDB2_9ACTN|nr:PIG-L deacetylase family protein [Skermania piniformis]QXQ15884.1 PIG-L family deacetylase [Skermania piniformis]